jgi:hypothetical protein
MSLINCYWLACKVISGSGYVLPAFIIIGLRLYSPAFLIVISGSF